MFSDALVSQFSRARLDLKVAAKPLVNAGNAAIVQLDIARQPQQFLLWPGAPTNQLIVQGTDRAMQQLVLFVKEPARLFEVRVRKEQANRRPILRKDRNPHFVWVQETSQMGQRHMLCGMDEQHYFIAQLPYGVSTVQEAHRALFNDEAGKAARQAGSKLIRQGEWFFVRASSKDAEALAPMLASVRRNMAANDGSNRFRRGRPHVCDELLQVRHAPVGSGLIENAVYVRGKVRHPDHRVLNLLQWHRVFGNEEASQAVGVQWVD